MSSQLPAERCNGHTLLTGHERNRAGTLAGYLRARRRAVLSIRGAYRTGRRTVRVYPRARTGDTP